MCHKKGWICGVCNRRFVDPPLYPCDLAADNVFPNRHCKQRWTVLWQPRDPKRTKTENEQRNWEKKCPDCETGGTRSEPAAESEPGIQASSDTGKLSGDEQASTVTEQPIEAGDRAVAVDTAEEDVEVDHAAGYESQCPTDVADQVEETAQVASVESEPAEPQSGRGDQGPSEELVARTESEDLIAGAEARMEAQAAALPASLDWDHDFPPLPSLSPALSGATNSMRTDSIAATTEPSALNHYDNGLVLPQEDVSGAAPALITTEQEEERDASDSPEPDPKKGHATAQSKDDDELLEGEYDMVNLDEGLDPDAADQDEDEDWEVLSGREDDDDEGHGVVDDYGVPLHKELPPRPEEA